MAKPDRKMTEDRQRWEAHAVELLREALTPTPEAVAGTYEGPDGEKIKVAPLTDEDRLVLVRWIDLGCPIDLDYDPAHPEARGSGWLQDDSRPTLTLTYPRAGSNAEIAPAVPRR